MIAPIREAEPPAQRRPRTTDEVRRFVASMFLDQSAGDERPTSLVSRWKAWLLIGWAIGITLVYFAAMLDLI